MKRLFSVLALILSLLSIPAFGQVEADINRPSVNADQFGLAVKAETALNKGQLSLNIPLMELKGKGYDLPISLSFYSGDVTCTTEASPIGLGWALMAGGVIAATVRGTDDIEDYTQDWKTDHHTDSNYLENNYRDPTGNFLDRIRWNAMPDEYTYSLPGHSGTIEMSVDNRTIKRTLFPDETYKIEFTDGGYCITADDGTKFYFNDAERYLDEENHYPVVRRNAAGEVVTSGGIPQDKAHGYSINWREKASEQAGYVPIIITANDIFMEYPSVDIQRNAYLNEPPVAYDFTW